MTGFAHLHVHSSFSPAWGVRSPAEFCAAARKMGMTRLALTDRNGLYGIPHFLEVAREAGIAPIIGAEAIAGGQRAVLLAADEEGYGNLCRLLSDLHCRPDFNLPQALLERQRGLFVLSDDRAVLAPLRRTAAGRLYVELSPGHQMHRALALARELELPPVASSRAVFLETGGFRAAQGAARHRRQYQALAPCAGSARRRGRPPAAAGKTRRFLPPLPAGAGERRRHRRALQDRLGSLRHRLSRLSRHGRRGSRPELEARARQGALWRYGGIDERVEARLRKELDLIRRKGFAHYFLVVEEIARQSERTCGRGSAAASLVAYCLGITHVDPVRHNLFFERFLNEGRTDPPDIDIDFPWDERDGVLDFAFARYGARRAAMVCNQVGFKGRAAVREVAKVYGIPAGEIKAVTERISGFWKADQTAGAVASHPLFQGEALSEEWREILGIARRLKGQLRHLSLHCGGLIIVPDEIRKHVPVEITAKGLPVIQWEKDQAEAAGLVKIDILGNRSLAVIRDALAAVQENTGIEIDYAAWRPLEDAATRALFHRGRTMGCFYVESPSIRLVLRKMWGENPDPTASAADLFESLVQVSSIIRPAANAFVREFVGRLRGKPWAPLHPLLGEVLDETYGIAIYQEQITQMAMALADFSAWEGDQLRKIVTKKHKEKKIADFRRRFFEGGEAKGVPEAVLSACWEQILSFAGYSFCKPHSASYALVSAKAAYLKANHPAEFMAAVISNQGGYYAPFAYLSECRRLGLHVLPPEINASAWHYSGREREVRMGLMQIHGLPRQSAAALICRAGEGRSLRRFCRFFAAGRCRSGRRRAAGRAPAASTLWRGRKSAPPSSGRCCAGRRNGSTPKAACCSTRRRPSTSLPRPPTMRPPCCARSRKPSACSSPAIRCSSTAGSWRASSRCPPPTSAAGPGATSPSPAGG